LRLEHLDENEEALKTVRTMLEHPGLTDEEREQLLDREAYNLFNTGRIDDGIASYDRRIAAAKDDPKKRLRLLGWKAQMARDRDRPVETMQACRAYRDAAEHGTDTWCTATFLLASELQRAGEHRAALKLFSEYWTVDQEPSILLDAAESRIALGENAEAEALFDQIQARANTLKQSTRYSDKETAGHLEQRIKDIRASTGG
jgi:tetratricopeptide (TPR) repeat protein